LNSYGHGMIQQGQSSPPVAGIEHILRDDLVEGDAVLASTRSILRHLLANRDQSLFCDEVIARVRGMVGNVAYQLLFSTAEVAQALDPARMASEAQDELAALIMEDTAFLSHAHAITLEAQMADQLQQRTGIDGVLSPLVQELAASSDPQVAAGAMRVIAAQARFLQHTRRMELPLNELPGDLFHKALVLLRNYLPDDAAAETAESRLRADYDETAGRLGQISRLVMSLGARATRALAVDHAGLALFATAVGMASGQDRNLAILSLGENQLARLALALRAGGLNQAAVEEQFVYLHPNAVLPEGFDAVTPERAVSLLGASYSGAGG
jgi:hypothetical protein